MGYRGTIEKNIFEFLEVRISSKVDFQLSSILFLLDEFCFESWMEEYIVCDLQSIGNVRCFRKFRSYSIWQTLYQSFYFVNAFPFELNSSSRDVDEQENVGWKYFQARDFPPRPCCTPGRAWGIPFVSARSVYLAYCLPRPPICVRVFGAREGAFVYPKLDFEASVIEFQVQLAGCWYV